MRNHARVSWLAFLAAALIVAPAAWTIGGTLADYTASSADDSGPAAVASEPEPAGEETRNVQRADLAGRNGAEASGQEAAVETASTDAGVGGASEPVSPDSTANDDDSTAEDTPDPTPTPRDAGVLAAGGGSVRPLTTPDVDVPQDLGGVRAWSGGDSMSYFVSRALLPRLEARGAVQVQPHAVARVSSGLLTPEFYDWQRAIPHEMEKYDPDLVVFMIGANDAEPDMDFDAYREAVANTMDLFEGRQVIWVGQPPMGPNRDDIGAAIPRINDIFAREAAQRPWVTYVDSYDLMSDADGNYMEVGADGTRLRSADGVHLTEEGGERIAEHVRDVIVNVMTGSN